MRWLSALSFAAAAGLLSGAGCARRQPPAEAGRLTGTLLLGNGAEPQDLDPHVVTAYTDYNVLIALFEGLTCIDEATSQAVPGIAERWEASPDGLTYTFHLRANATWSNGDPVTAEDFAYSIRRALSPKLASENSYLLYPLKNAEDFNAGRVTDFGRVGVRVIDPRTLELALGRPCPYLPALVAHQVWFPVHRGTIEKYGRIDQRGTGWTLPGHFVGNGPFLLQEWTPNSRVVVVKNPRYWDAARNRLNRVIFFPNEDIATNESNFRADQLHITYLLLPDRIDYYRARAPETLRIDPFSESWFLRFNVTRPPLNDARVRRALSFAIDRDAIARHVLHGSVQPATVLTPPDTGGYSAGSGPAGGLEEARRLLAEAGFPGGRNFPRLEVQMNTNAINSEVLQAIQEMWRNGLGVEAVLTNQDFRVYLDNQRTLSYQVSRSRWVGDYNDPSTYLDLFRSDSGNNQTGWSSPEYDRLIDAADAARDSARRFAILRQAEALLIQEAPIAPVFFGTRVYLIKPYVRGWVPSLLGIHRYQYVWLDR